MSIEFGGSDDEIVSGDDLSLADGFTIAFWATRINKTRNSNPARFFVFQNGGSFNEAISVYTGGGSNDYIAVQFRDGSPVTNWSNVRVATSSNTTLGNWNPYVLIVHSGGTTFSLRCTSGDVKGVLVDDAVTIGNSIQVGLSGNLTRLAIGGRDGAAQDNDGKIRRFCVWDKELSNDEQIAFCNGMHPLSIAPSTLEFWQEGDTSILNERSGVTLSDGGGDASLDLDDNPPIIGAI